MYLQLVTLNTCAFPQDDKKNPAFPIPAGGRNSILSKPAGAALSMFERYI
jgi:hypothetical protein